MKKITIGVMLHINSITLFIQNFYRIDDMDYKKGLHSLSTSAIVQDYKGLIWISSAWNEVYQVMHV